MKDYLLVLAIATAIFIGIGYCIIRFLNFIEDGIKILSKLGDALIKIVKLDRSKRQNFNFSIDALLILFMMIGIPLIFNADDSIYKIVSVLISLLIIGLCVAWVFSDERN